jgi:Phosphodiester glycosidase
MVNRFHGSGATFLKLLAGVILAISLFNWLNVVKASSTVKPKARIIFSQDIHATQGVLYTVTIPAQLIQAVSSTLRVVSAKHLAPLKEFTTGDPQEILINAGYFDPKTGLSTSYMVNKDRIILDPEQNPGLTGNPRLTPYLPAILNRSELRILNCNATTTLQIAPHKALPPNQCQLQQALGAGPGLSLSPELTLPQLNTLLQQQLKTEGFIDLSSKGTIIRDPLGINRPNARSAMALTPKGDVILLMGAKDKPNGGFTMLDMARIAQQKLEASRLLFLDGGSSSGLWVNQHYYAGLNLDPEKPQARAVKTVLMFSPNVPKN